MDGETRSNQGYEIIESCTIGNTELVIGHHPKAPNPYVCWYCKGGDKSCSVSQTAGKSLSLPLGERKRSLPAAILTKPIPKWEAIFSTYVNLPSVWRKTVRPMSRSRKNSRPRKHRSIRIWKGKEDF